MRRWLGFALAWIGATVVAVAIAGAAVGSVRSQVTDAPTALGSPEAAALASTSPPTSENSLDTPERSQAPSSTTTMSVEAAASPSTSTTTTVPSTTTTEADRGGNTTTTTKAPSTSTTTTTEPPSSYTKTYDTNGGWVRFTVDGDLVAFSSAQPKTGWRVEVENEGPEEVEVHFEENDESSEIEFSAKVKGGELDVRISSEDDDH